MITESLSGTRVPHTHNKSTVYLERSSGDIQTFYEEKNPKKSTYIMTMPTSTINKIVEHNHLVFQIVVHRHFESLLEYVPLKYLPEDYGGESPSMIELHGKS